MNALFERARKLDIVDSGSQLIFNDLLSDCKKEIAKQEQQMQRCLGRIDQLKLVEAMMTQVISKYCRMQEEHDENARQAEERRKKEPVKKKKTKKVKK